MNIQIIDTPFQVQVHGFSGTAIGGDYAGTAFKLMDRMWKIVKANDLKNKGLNIWVYEPDEMVFAGVELDDTNIHGSGLEKKSIAMQKYAYYKHVGPYGLIKKVGTEMRDELKRKNLEVTSPYIEIYGHWSNDESKLETELLMGIV